MVELGFTPVANSRSGIQPRRILSETALDDFVFLEGLKT
jgi:hypothetical protein